MRNNAPKDLARNERTHSTCTDTPFGSDKGINTVSLSISSGNPSEPHKYLQEESSSSSSSIARISRVRECNNAVSIEYR
jgi:hypothetical protein